MHNLQNTSTFQSDTEHVFSLFYEIKQEHPFLEEKALMSSLNQVTGWEYPSSRKDDLKYSVLKMLIGSPESVGNTLA